MCDPQERDIMKYSEYISQSMGKGTVGSTISMGIFIFIAVMAALGLYFGLKRGFAKTVIRFFTIILSAFGSLYSVKAVLNIIINLAEKSDADSVDQLIESYSPGLVSGFPPAVQSILSEMNPETATIFVMMIVCLFVAPFTFISFFYLFKTLTFLLYKLLAGLVGAIDYRKGILSIIFGGVIGVIQGVVIAGIILMPIGGLCNVIEIAEEPLVGSGENSNQQMAEIYTNIFDDLVDNPVFDTIEGFGGKAAYEQMVNVKIGGEKLNMAEESKGVLKLFSDASPLMSKDFDWKQPNEDQKKAFQNLVSDIGGNDLISSLVSDTMRGFAACVDNGDIKLPFEGTNKDLMDDVFGIFRTSTKDNIEEDLDMIVDVYLIMCEKDLINAFNRADNEEMRELLTEKDEDGKTIIDVILNRLNESERGKPIVHSFTKISLTLMQGAIGGDIDSAQLYEEVKDDIQTVLSHNKEDFETVEEYKEAVKDDLNKALEENNLSISEDVKDHMVDYIEQNFSNKSDITDDDINDAILSYYNAYASARGNESTNP